MSLSQNTITRERIAIAIRPTTLKDEQVERLILLALGSGFEVANKVATDWAKELKGEYKGVTGQQWGKNQSATWTPEHWQADLELEKQETLIADVNNTRARFEAKIAEVAAAKKNNEFAGKKEIYEREIAICSEKIDALTEALEKHREDLAARKLSSQVVTCSGCGLEGSIENGKLVALSHCTTNVSTRALETLVKNTESDLANLQAKLGAAQQGYKQADVEIVAIDDAAVEVERAALTLSEQRLQAFTKKHRATSLHKQIEETLRVADIVSPDGLPMRALQESLETVNAKLGKLCDLAGWSRVAISRDLRLTYRDRPYKIISESEKYRCDVTFQMFAARALKSQIVLLDQADILDKNGRDDLFNLLAECGITAIVGMTAEAAPNMGALDCGCTYVVENGTVREMVTSC